MTSHDQSASTDNWPKTLLFCWTFRFSWTRVKMMLSPFTNLWEAHFADTQLVHLSLKLSTAPLDCMLLSSVSFCEARLCLDNMIVCLQHRSFYNRYCTLNTKYTLLSLSLFAHKVTVWVLLLSYSVYGLVIYVNNSPWWLCLFHVADRYKIPIKNVFLTLPE